MVSSQSTVNFELAKNWASQDSKTKQLFEIYAPAQIFRQADLSGTGFSFSVSDGEIYGMGVGNDPYIDPAWQSCSLWRYCDQSLLKNYKKRHNWDVYVINTQSHELGEACEELQDDIFIRDFLEENAPDSSVLPLDDEVLFWGGVRNSLGQITSLGTVVKWRNDKYMFASIATSSQSRGEGFAQLLVAGMLSNLFQRGIVEVGLGVFAENVAAKRVYEKLGFELLYELTSWTKEK